MIGCLLGLPVVAIVTLLLEPPGVLIAEGLLLGVVLGLALSALYYR